MFLKEPDMSRNQWPLARVTEVYYGSKHECMRSVKLQIGTRELKGDHMFKSVQSLHWCCC